MALDININALARQQLFGEFEPEALRLLAFAAQPLEFGHGEVICRRGELSDGGILVLSGHLRLESAGDGTAIGPGHLIGIRALLTPTRNSSTVNAEDNATVLKISRHLLRRVLDEFPASAAGMRRALAKELERLGDDIENSRQAIVRVGVNALDKIRQDPIAS